MIQNIPITCSVKIKICVVCNIHYSFLVGCTGIIHYNLVAVCPCIGNSCIDFPRETFFHIRAYIGKFYSRKFAILKNFSIPNNAMPTFRSSMKCVWPIINGRIINYTIKSKFSFGNPVGKSSYNRSERHITFECLIKSIISEGNILLLPIFVGNLNPVNFCSEICKSYNITRFVCKG